MEGLMALIASTILLSSSSALVAGGSSWEISVIIGSKLCERNLRGRHHAQNPSNYPVSSATVSGGLP